MGDGAGHPCVRQRQHGRAAGGRAAATSACGASAGSSRRIAPARCRPRRGRSRTTTRSPSSTGPPETGYVALSEAMVNIRATLAQAEAAGIIAAATRDALARARQGAVLPRSQLRSPARAGRRGVPARSPSSPALRDLAAGWPDRPEASRCARPCWRDGSPAGERCRAQAGRLQLEWTEMWDDATLAAAGALGAGRGDRCGVAAGRRGSWTSCGSIPAAYARGTRSRPAAPSRAPRGPSAGTSPPRRRRSAPRSTACARATACSAAPIWIAGSRLAILMRRGSSS